MKSIINSHKKKFTTKKLVITPRSKFRSKGEYILEDEAKVEYIIYKGIASRSVKDNKVYLGGADDCSNKQSFKNEQVEATTLSDYIWNMKEKYNKIPLLKEDTKF